MQYVHTCYRVLDLDRSLDFYTNKLGLELARKSSPSITTAKSPTLWARATVTSPSPSRTWTH